MSNSSAFIDFGPFKNIHICKSFNSASAGEEPKGQNVLMHGENTNWNWTNLDSSPGYIMS